MLTIISTLIALIDTIARARKAARATVRRAAAPAVVAHRNGPAVADAIASGALVTIATHLAALHADEDTTRRYGPTLGKRAKAAHKAATGREPMHVWEVSPVGYPIQVAAYSPADPALIGATVGYPRTAHLVTA